MTRVEHADGDRRGAFPASWGTPPGEAGSEERAGWIAVRVRRAVMLKMATPADLRAYTAGRRRSP